MATIDQVLKEVKALNSLKGNVEKIMKLVSETKDSVDLLGRRMDQLEVDKESTQKELVQHR